MNEHISVMTDFGELIATPFAGVELPASVVASTAIW